MKEYHSTAYMLDEMAKDGWIKEPIPKGYTLTPNHKLGEGYLIVWGNPKRLCMLDLDVSFHTPQFMVNFSKQCGIQITFVEESTIEYYRDQSEIETGQFGNFAYVNNTCIPWFKHYPAKERSKAITLMISHEFLQEEGINLTSEDWNRFARGINGRNTSLPAITSILKQIRQSNISDELFQKYFKVKALEVFLLLWDYAQKKERTDLKRLNTKSHFAVKETLHILDQSFLSPPIIADLAKMVGADKKTLQFAFKEIVGLSIHKYIRTLKMQKALLLLEDASKTIEDISRDVGYQSKIHFYKAFDDTFGMKPLQMRKILYNDGYKNF